MGTVIDLVQWRRTRVAPAEVDMERLERAVRRLDAVATAALESAGSLDAWVETEMLAIMGALATDLLADAAVRAERLADRLSRSRRSVTR